MLSGGVGLHERGARISETSPLLPARTPGIARLAALMDIRVAPSLRTVEGLLPRSGAKVRHGTASCGRNRAGRLRAVPAAHRDDLDPFATA